GERIPGIERHSLMVNGEQQMEKSGRYDRILKPQLQLIRGLFLTRIISCLGANHELLVALLLRVHTDRSVAGNAFRREWLVTDGVLAANVVRHRAADFIHLIQALWEECDSTSALGNHLQGTARGALFLLPQ